MQSTQEEDFLEFPSSVARKHKIPYREIFGDIGWAVYRNVFPELSE